MLMVQLSVVAKECVGHDHASADDRYIYSVSHPTGCMLSMYVVHTLFSRWHP
jgi:hypothetical protein